MSNRMLQNLTPFIAVAALVTLAACSEPEPPPEPTEIVAERAQQRWDALVAEDYEAAYALYTPGFRERTDLRSFEDDMQRRPVRWVSAEVRTTECEKERCTVETDVGYRVTSAPAQLSGMGSSRPVEESWIYINDNWWFVPAS